MHYLLFLLIIPGVIILYIIYFFIIMSVMEKKKIYYTIPENENIHIYKDIIYTQEDTDPMGNGFPRGNTFPKECDIYSPSRDKKTYPCVVLIQGDAPDFFLKKSKNWGIFQSYGRLLAANGITAVAFTRRSSNNEKQYDEAVKDLTTLMDFIQKNGESYNIDTDRIIPWAFSFGALLGLSWALPRPKEYIKGIISYYGLLASKNPRHSPVDCLGTMKSLNFPILLAKAEKDMKRIRESNDLFHTIAKNKGMDITLLTHPTGRHAFDVMNDNERTREIITETIAFVKKCGGV